MLRLGCWARDCRAWDGIDRVAEEGIKVSRMGIGEEVGRGNGDTCCWSGLDGWMVRLGRRCEGACLGILGEMDIADIF